MNHEIAAALSGHENLLMNGFFASWSQGLLWTLVIAKLAIGISYVVIAVILLNFSRTHRKQNFGSIFAMVSAFIFFCGITHFIDVAVIWDPLYRFDAAILVATAAISLSAAGTIYVVIPKISAFLSGKRTAENNLLAANRQLSQVLEQLEQRAKIDAKHLQSEEQFHRLVDSITDTAIYLLDMNGIISTWNSGAQRIKGYRADEVVGRHVSFFYRPEDIAARLPEAALKTAETTGQYKAEAWRIRKNGSRFMAEVTINAIRDEQGVLAGFSKITRDITLLKEAEHAKINAERQQASAAEREKSAEALARMNEMLTKIFDASPVGIACVDANGVIEVWNKAAEQVYGYSAEEMIGQQTFSTTSATPIMSVGGPDPAQVFAMASGDEVLRGIPAVRRRKDGSTVNISVSSAPLKGQTGERNGIVFIIEDVTQRNAVAEQLRHSQKMEAIGQLTGGIAHDFNNLLSIIICNLELLAEDLTPGSEMQVLCNTAMQASLHGADLIHQMLAYSRSQSLESKLLQLNELVRDMAKLLARTLGEQIEVSLNIDPHACHVMIDPVQFQTALTNLATNARDAMPEGGKLVINTNNVILDDYTAQFADVPPGDYVVLAVTDTGTGMPPAVVERAFDPFFTTKSVGQGTGLGLSMVFGFVKQSGGHIRIYSELGQGTTVKLYLPCSGTTAETDTVTKSNAELPYQGNATILIVEDNEALARSARTLLMGAGFTTLLAFNGKQALEVLGTGTEIDLLFTDIVMPGGINGIELARQARLMRPAIKVLITSGFADAALNSGNAAALSEQLLTKPYRKADLIKKIRELL